MKNVLITGASRGVGLALSQRFLSEGHAVFCTSRDIRKLKLLQNDYPDSCKPYQLDLNEEESIAFFADAITRMNVSFDIVIHNSGAIVNKAFQEISQKELLYTYAVNVLGPYQLTQKLIPLLSVGAHVVFISSMGGFQGTQKFAGLTAYSSSKAAVASLTECLQEEFKESDIAFNCLCLGAVQTEMLQNAFPGYQAPLNPEQMSDYIYQFSTTANRFLKGKIIPVSLSTP